MYVGIWFLSITLSIMIASSFIYKNKLIQGTVINTFVLFLILLFCYLGNNDLKMQLFVKILLLPIILSIPIFIMLTRKKKEIDINKNEFTEYIRKGGNINDYLKEKAI